MSSSVAAVSSSNLNASAAQFREIHKNTWLKRLTAEGKRITVGPKKSERSWVVFCVHDDTDALLEGYAEPRQAASHSPEWIVSMQDTLHISHALIPNSHEFEFVVTLSNEVVRFHAMSWYVMPHSFGNSDEQVILLSVAPLLTEIMQEWVETLRSKLREMKILSPRENLYTKLPEIRAPLLPTRDPTSPLPAPPPVPAALVPGVERVVPQSNLQVPVSSIVVESVETTTVSLANIPTLSTTTETSAACVATSTTPCNTINLTSTTSAAAHTTLASTASHNICTTTPMLLSAMSNTLTQNLLNMLSDPISAYSEQLNNDEAAADAAAAANNTYLQEDVEADEDNDSDSEIDDEFLSETAFHSENSLRVNIGASNGSSADIRNLENLLQCERLIPRPHTSRSLSAGAADKPKKQPTPKLQSKELETAPTVASKNNNITALEINADSTKQTSATTTSTTAADCKTNVTIIQVSTNSNRVADDGDAAPPKLPIKSITAEIFKFPETTTTPMTTAAAKAKFKQHEYKSNVQIIPSSQNSSTIQVLGPNSVAITAPNQYSTPVKKSVPALPANSAMPIPIATTHCETQKITTVHVSGDAGANSASVYAIASSAAASTHSTPRLPKKIILSANTSGVTSITVNNSTDTLQEEKNDDMAIRIHRDATTSSTGDISVNVHYDKIFLSSSIPIAAATTVANCVSTSVMATVVAHPPSSRLAAALQKSPRRCPTGLPPPSSAQPATSHPTGDATKLSLLDTKTRSPQINETTRDKSMPSSTSITASRAPAVVSGSPALQRRRIASPINLQRLPGTGPLQLPTRPPFLKRGLTEAVITARPSRKDFHFLKLTPTKSSKAQNNTSIKNPAAISAASTSTSAATITTCNNNDEPTSTSLCNGAVSGPLLPLHAALTRTNSESLEQRRRSSSTSDAPQAQRSSRGANNNEFPSGRGGNNGALRIQQPPQPFRSVENGLGSGIGSMSAPTATTNSPAAKRITIREQQVMQLRREIMHPGGVRLQLRRKDCVGSIAWVDAFGAVWVAGWKQKEHPVLYNALHIGDQLISIAGMAVSTAAEANKSIRNANTLFVEVLVRRLPFGRGYAIRREREGQCLGLIRDGNTATIVDVVPNSLAARHGLPPKAQSCDGTTLTFWVLTEINGRPLNLFFKEHEIRDRLNSVGRDISILVQPSDLVTKLKKQLKSLRGYKDYLVQ